MVSKANICCCVLSEMPLTGPPAVSLAADGSTTDSAAGRAASCATVNTLLPETLESTGHFIAGLLASER